MRRVNDFEFTENLVETMKLRWYQDDKKAKAQNKELKIDTQNYFRMKSTIPLIMLDKQFL
mgnify:CR=1 FL=1